MKLCKYFVDHRLISGQISLLAIFCKLKKLKKIYVSDPISNRSLSRNVYTIQYLVVDDPIPINKLIFIISLVQ